MEDRVTRLEVIVENMQGDIADIKTDVRKLNDKIDAVDQKLTAKIDAVDQKLTAKIDAVDQKLTEKIDAVDQKLTVRIDSLTASLADLKLATEKGFGNLKVWWLMTVGTLLSVMAHGFHWI